MSRKYSGVYSRYVFPWLCDWALNQPLLAKRRRELLASISGDVLEVGVGTGLNLPCYPSSIRKLTVVEPNPGMRKRLLRRIHETGIDVDQRSSSTEGLPFQDCSFDFVVSTFTLCSIKNVGPALQEIQRVLNVGGRFVFLEHGRSPDPKVQRWQRRLNWLQGILGDGCRLDLDVRQIVAAAPFQSVEVDNYYLEQTPHTHGYLYQGSAGK